MDTAFDLEVEQAVLGAFLIDDSTSWSRIGVFFCPEPFYVQDHLNDVNNSCRSAEVVVALAQLRNLHVSATDLDVSVTSGHKCEVLKEGKVAVPAKQSGGLCRHGPPSRRRRGAAAYRSRA